MVEHARITLHDKYVLVTITGAAFTPAEIQATAAKAIENAIGSQLNIIIHRKSAPVKQRASVVDFYEFAGFLDDSKFIGQIALVFPEEMHQDKLGFLENASRNRGVNFKLFSDMEEALEWIGAGKDETTS
jgi:hypothetical protein